MSKVILLKKLLILTAMVATVLCQPLFAAMLSQQTPPAQYQDMITHDKGNIVTTVENWGLVGGFSHYYLASGEYPKNSGHNYLAEMKYWMGAITASGDTVVANTDDDFMPIPALVSDRQSYGIHLSTTDSTYNYSSSDTVGLGFGYPAYGWRTWNPETRTYDYNKIWDPVNEEFVDGGPIAQQESHYRMSDDALGSSVLGIEVSHTIYQWNYSYNQDYMFIVLEITNTSEENYSEFAFGLYCDFDVGGFDGQGENGRLGDLVAFDVDRNLAWTYDEDAYDEGWRSETCVMGTKYIETPDGIGMTAFRTGQWEQLPETDPGKFLLIDSEQFDESLPPTDQYYIQCTRGIDLQAGKTVRVVYALVAAENAEKLRQTADMAQAIYDNNFVGPEPPVQAKLEATPDDGSVKLWWNNVAETTADRFSGELDFVGYKIYRSTDFGLTWGELTKNSDGSRGPGFEPIVSFEKADENDIVNHTYVDEDVVNGFEYWYSLTAYDGGDESLSLSILESAYGTPGSDSNAVSVRPRSRPSGYYPIERTIQHTTLETGKISQGEITVAEFNASLMTDSEYEVTFSDDPYSTWWHLVNTTTGDTLIAEGTDQTADEELSVVTEGFRLLVKDGEFHPVSLAQTEFAVPGDTTLSIADDDVLPLADLAGLPTGGSMHFRPDYEIRFTSGGSVGYWWWDDVTPMDLPFEIWNMSTNQQVVAEIIDWNYDQQWTPLDPEDGSIDYIVIVNIPYDGNPHPEGYPYYHAWVTVIDPAGMDRWGPGDVLTMYGAPLNGPNDVFSFKSSGVDYEAAKTGLDNIKVVPNPYIVSAAWESAEGEKRLEFTHLPDVCTIRIYTLAGDLVSTIEHSNNGGTAAWDLSSSNAQGVAPGIYLYSIESEYGSKIGKFAVIK